MSISTIPLSSPIGSTLAVDTQSDVTAESIKTSSATAFLIDCDNTLNDDSSFTKLYNVNVSPTVGTTVPAHIIRSLPNVRLTVTIGQGEGGVLGTGIFMATVTTGGTGGVTSPTSNVTAKLLYT